MMLYVKVFILVCVVVFVGRNKGDDLCVGTGCSCTEYPVRIQCNEGRPDMIKKLLKRVAVSMEVHGRTIQDLLVIDLDEFVSLTTLDVFVYKKDACFWAMDKQKQYKQIVFNIPDFCEHFRQADDITGSSSSTPETLTTAGALSNGKTRVINITITVNNLILGFVFMACLSACGMFRSYLRYVSIYIYI